jgi:methyl-accepting chemotaxis protein
MRKNFANVKTAVDALIAFNNDGVTTAGNAAQPVFSSARLWIYGAIALAILLCFAACYILIAAVSKPLVKITDAMAELASGKLDTYVPHSDQDDEIGKLADAMTSFKNQLAAAEHSKAEQTEALVGSIGTGLEHLAKGDLTHRVTSNLTGPFAKLKEDFNIAMGQLQDTVTGVLSVTAGIANGANEISTAADDLSRRTEQQAASLEETAAALEEITASVKSAASNARGASGAIGATKAVAEEGGQVVESAIKAMDAIAQSSRQVTDIIGVIDEIAFQTNLLALNAGVEAARAGDAGRGFAVVASEVRGLAQRSSEAAKQIKSLIKASGEHVGAGVKLVGESGQVLKRIIEQVVEIDGLARNSAEAGQQQSSGIEEVNTAVSSMDQATQQNAAMVEQSTAASRNLASETQRLQELVGFFDVGAATPVQRPVQRPVPQPRAVLKAVPRPASRPVRRGTAATAAKPVADEDSWTEF